MFYHCKAAPKEALQKLEQDFFITLASDSVCINEYFVAGSDCIGLASQADAIRTRFMTNGQGFYHRQSLLQCEGVTARLFLAINLANLP